ncbi:MAG: uncharacterized protein JWN73_2076 [Betaproteobacteria bacterium]|nr:uncharacterized protein [Betaproteobacteria bacterium]
MFKQLLGSLRKPAPRPAAVDPLAARTAEVLAAHAAFQKQCAELYAPAHAADATPQTLHAYAHACYEAQTAAGDAECEWALRRTLELAPHDPAALYALALLVSADGRFAEAETLLRAAHALAHDDINVRFALAMGLLQRNNYAEGYRLFGVRMATTGHAAPHITPLPAWQGEPLAGKSLVLWTDWGGFGDHFAYVRYARVIQETFSPARLIVAAHRPMLRLLAAQPHVDEVMELDAPVAADLQCSMIEAINVLGHDYASLPAWPAYLEPPAPEAAAWAARLRDEKRLKVGLTWTSTSVPLIDIGWTGRYDKHLTDHAVRGLGGIDNVVYISLQKGAGIARAAELLPAGSVLDHTDELADFADTAALISRLDLVVTIDTAVAHLAGALGVPTLLLLKKSRGYFWPGGREDTPWYPSVRMLVQPEVRDWGSVLGRARAVLARRAAGVPWPHCADET